MPFHIQIKGSCKLQALVFIACIIYACVYNRLYGTQLLTHSFIQILTLNFGQMSLAITVDAFMHMDILTLY